MIVRLLTEHHMECLSLRKGCRGSSESTHVEMPHCWTFHAAAHFMIQSASYHEEASFRRISQALILANFFFIKLHFIHFLFSIQGKMAV